MTELTVRLRDAGIPFMENEPMSAHTSFHIGGPAECFVSARSAEDCANALCIAQRVNTPVYVVGNGSNLLIRDGGLRGMVLHIGEQMSRMECEGTHMYIQAGALLAAAAQRARMEGLAGMSALSGIPGFVGGAAAMNAGAYGAEMAQIVTKVEAMTRQGQPVILTNEQMEYGYRTSRALREELVITGVHFELKRGDSEKIALEMAEYAARRRDKQPLTLPSAGSFFKRPENGFASALVDQAGLRGVAVGGAQISEKHAGFFVNIGGATASDMLALMKLAQDRVKERFNVRLEPEVRIWGEDA